MEASSRQIIKYRSLPEEDETAQTIEYALTAPLDGQAETVETLGGGWVAVEALAIALTACLAGRSLENAQRISVTHIGEGDRTGVVAANMLGLMYSDQLGSHHRAGRIKYPDLLDGLLADCPKVYSSMLEP